ncbi:hypothetical protein LTS18_007713 [Coniosporium uncinatum]|uniref:Uncharacterized protein n=1 Tax=Coniosporium uncinatum TaxID=93489 RepID=A0ACC3D2M1_9PEZI|nr:hypothetical protein LTS18_007713 [Coniosporium uncinatum]
MAAVLSPQATSDSPSPSSLGSRSPTSASLPPLITSPAPCKSSGERNTAFAAKSRISTYSNTGNNTFSQSRPQSLAFPLFHSSLSYSLVRDFAYPHSEPLHYGPPAESTSVSSPASEDMRRLSDWEAPSGGWAAERWDPTEQLPMLSFSGGSRDGPPFDEDDDLASPVITSAKHRKPKPNMVGFDQVHGRSHYDAASSEGAGVRGGERTTNPAGSSSRGQTSYSQTDEEDHDRRDSHFQATLPSRSYTVPIIESDDFELVGDNDPDDEELEESRYSRDYQFTIASHDEEMHGTAIALFDFEKENQNELPLKEGQIILVSYRHGDGWLVAEDPLTNESGLVPEEFVRLLREIEGGLDGLIENREGTTEPHALHTEDSAEGTSGALSDGANDGATGADAEGAYGANVDAAATEEPAAAREVVATKAAVRRPAEDSPEEDSDGGIPLTAEERRELGGRSPTEEVAKTPTQAEHGRYNGTFYPPVVSHFSTRRELFGNLDKEESEPDSEASDGVMMKVKDRKGGKSS